MIAFHLQNSQIGNTTKNQKACNFSNWKLSSGYHNYNHRITTNTLYGVHLLQDHIVCLAFVFQEHSLLMFTCIKLLCNIFDGFQ